MQSYILDLLTENVDNDDDVVPVNTSLSSDVLVLVLLLLLLLLLWYSDDDNDENWLLLLSSISVSSLLFVRNLLLHCWYFLMAISTLLAVEKDVVDGLFVDMVFIVELVFDCVWKCGFMVLPTAFFCGCSGKISE